MKLRSAALVVACSLSPWALAATADTTSPFEQVRPTLEVQRVIVKWRDTPDCAGNDTSDRQQATSQQVVGLASALGYAATAVPSFTVEQHVLLDLGRHVSWDEAAQLVGQLQTDTCVEHADADARIHPAFAPDDTRFAQQWYLNSPTGGVNAPPMWDNLPTAPTSVNVAILDTGAASHPDLSFVHSDTDAGDAVSAGYCYAGSPASLNSWHGSKVAGIIAARLSNNTGVSGIVGYNDDLPTRTLSVTLNHYKVLGKCGGSLSDLVQKLNDAVTYGTSSQTRQVIHMSLQADGACPSSLQTAIDRAVANNMPVVAAAGNSKKDVSTSYPANCRGVVSVAATNRVGGRAYYSNFGTGVTLAAPGGEISLTSADGIMTTINPSTSGPALVYNGSNMSQFLSAGYVYAEGTSFAAPIVSATLAMVISAYAKSATEAVDIVKSTTRPFPQTCSGCGSGIVDVYAALLKAKPARRPPPPPPDCDLHPELCH